MQKTKLLLPVLALTLATAAVVGVSSVSAQSETEPHQTIIERLAERFGVETSEVQSVFDEVHQERQAEREAQVSERLQAAVDAGDLTAEQMQLILDKMAQMRQNKPEKPENWQDLTQEERRAAMETRREEMQTRKAKLEIWAEEHGIDLQYLHLGKGPDMGRGHGPRPL